MKIAMVSEHASPLAAIGGEDVGGQNVHVAALTTSLARSGHDVTVWTRRDDPDLPRRVEFDGVAVEHVDAGPPQPIAKDRLLPWMNDFADTLEHTWAVDPPDVVHAHFWMSGYATLHARPPQTPVVQTFHALGLVKRRHLGPADPSPPGRLDIEATIARNVDRIVATCHDELRELCGMGADASRVDVVPCGVDLARFVPDGPREQPWRRNRIVAIGRLVPRKGIDDAIRALVALPDVELVIAGGLPAAELHHDDEARRLLEIACQAGVADRVELRGGVARDDVPPLLRSADVVVCTPWYEPFGIVPLEAMACGVPVVASAVGGMLDTVVEGVTGLHVPPCDPQALAIALRRLLDDPALRQRMSANGRQRAVGNYGWDTVAAQTLDVYRALGQRAVVPSQSADSIAPVVTQ
jgi:glycosyltransferase involved in cell wall biosynthesis